MYLEDLFGLKGKVTLVTGASRGIGQAVARGLAKAGAVVVNFSRSGGEETMEMIREDGGVFHDYRVDVTKEDEVDRALDEVLRDVGPVEILFNNAGICLHKSALESTIDEFRRIIDVNVTGEFIVARAVGKVMVKQGIQGSIINMASISGTIVNIPQQQASYNASKAAVIQMTKSLAIEWAPYNIRVNSISPGYINTPMASDTPQALRDAWDKLVPMRRMAEAEELMTAILYLASPASTYTTGSDIIVDGGYVCL